MELWSHYHALEPEIKVNTIPYDIRIRAGAAYVSFQAVSRFNEDDYVETLLPRSTFEQCKTGLSVACVYNSILDSLERQVLEYL